MTIEEFQNFNWLPGMVVWCGKRSFVLVIIDHVANQLMRWDGSRVNAAEITRVDNKDGTTAWGGRLTAKQKIKVMPRQSRSNFNPIAVLKAMTDGDEIPEPMSTLEEACHRIMALENSIRAAAELSGKALDELMRVSRYMRK